MNEIDISDFDLSSPTLEKIDKVAREYAQQIITNGFNESNLAWLSTDSERKHLYVDFIFFDEFEFKLKLDTINIMISEHKENEQNWSSELLGLKEVFSKIINEIDSCYK